MPARFFSSGHNARGIGARDLVNGFRANYFLFRENRTPKPVSAREKNGRARVKFYFLANKIAIYGPAMDAIWMLIHPDVRKLH